MSTVSGLEVELTEGERVVDAKTQNHLDRVGRATTVVGQFNDLSDVAAVADFGMLKRNDEALVQVRRVVAEGARSRVLIDIAKPVGDVEVDRTEVALEDIDVLAVGRVAALTHRADRGRGHSRTVRGRVDEAGEGSLQVNRDESIPRAALARLLVQSGEHILTVGLVEVSGGGTGVRVGDSTAGTADRLRRGGGDDVVSRGAILVGNGEDGVLFPLGLSPSIEGTGAVAHGAVVSLSGLGRSQGDFDISLDGEHRLSHLAGTLRRGASEANHIGLGQFRDAELATEDLRVSRESRTVADRELIHLGTTRGVASDGLVSAVNDGLDAGIGVGIDLPLEHRVGRFSTLAGHRSEGGILRFDERDHIGDVFTTTDSVGFSGRVIALKISFKQSRHSSLVPCGGFALRRLGTNETLT